jgi:hypothetical protein
MPFRRTKGILSDDTDPVKDADVIMTAAILGLAAEWVKTPLRTPFIPRFPGEQQYEPIRFDIDPEDANPYDRNKGEAWDKFITVVKKLRSVINLYLKIEPQTYTVDKWVTPDFIPGKAIGADGKVITEDRISPEGRELYKKIVTGSIVQYTGRGAYTGFVDNPKGMPVAPLSTVRFKAPEPGDFAPDLDPHPRWLPPGGAGLSLADWSPLWRSRLRKDQPNTTYSSYVPWGLIGGNDAGKTPQEPNDSRATNRADQLTDEMRRLRMAFAVADPLDFGDIAVYTHGMIQAIYKAEYLNLPPGGHAAPATAAGAETQKAVPCEIAAGAVTKKLASCIPCTLFMVANGYRPSAIHLGRGESWGPLYEPYPVGSPESDAVRQLNNKWYKKCWDWLSTGTLILDAYDHQSLVKDERKKSVVALSLYLTRNCELHSFEGATIPTVAGVLILDALTIHKSEQDRIDATLRLPD